MRGKPIFYRSDFKFQFIAPLARSCKLQVTSCKTSSKTGTDLIQIKTRSVFLFVSPQAEHFIFCEAKYFTFAQANTSLAVRRTSLWNLSHRAINSNLLLYHFSVFVYRKLFHLIRLKQGAEAQAKLAEEATGCRVVAGRDMMQIDIGKDIAISDIEPRKPEWNDAWELKESYQ